MEFEQYLSIFKENIKDLPFLPSYIKDGKVQEGDKALAIDMGGTHIRFAELTFNQRQESNMSNYRTFPTPGSQGEISADDFFNFVASEIERSDLPLVGFCFSDPANILPDGDGEVIKMTKEVQITGINGKILGQELNKRLSKQRKITVINDTVATHIGTTFCQMALVLGTGFNISIVKDGQIINTECGSFTKFPTEEFDVGNLSEMQASGKYIPNVIEHIGKEAAYDRAAKVIASEIAGLASYSDKKNFINIAADGSVFHEVKELQDKICSYLTSAGLQYQILNGRGKSLEGAAKAAILKQKDEA